MAPGLDQEWCGQQEQSCCATPDLTPALRTDTTAEAAEKGKKREITGEISARTCFISFKATEITALQLQSVGNTHKGGENQKEKWHK